MDNCLSRLKTPDSTVKPQAAQSQKYDSIFNGKKILVVEDIEINCEIVLQMLAITKAKMDIANNGIEAIEKFGAANGEYDMILMDIQMPIMDGYKATKEIRKMPFENSKKVPIIAMTANAFNEDIERCLESGMNAHVGKPINRNVLIEKMSDFLNT
jgi:CheY-like chemotaxis protein